MQLIDLYLFCEYLVRFGKTHGLLDSESSKRSVDGDGVLKLERCAFASVKRLRERTPRRIASAQTVEKHSFGRPTAGFLLSEIGARRAD